MSDIDNPWGVNFQIPSGNPGNSTAPPGEYDWYPDPYVNAMPPGYGDPKAVAGGSPLANELPYHTMPVPTNPVAFRNETGGFLPIMQPKPQGPSYPDWAGNPGEYIKMLRNELGYQSPDAMREAGYQSAYANLDNALSAVSATGLRGGVQAGMGAREVQRIFSPAVAEIENAYAKNILDEQKLAFDLANKYTGHQLEANRLDIDAGRLDLEADELFLTMMEGMPDRSEFDNINDYYVAMDDWRTSTRGMRSKLNERAGIQDFSRGAEDLAPEEEAALGDLLSKVSL